MCKYQINSLWITLLIISQQLNYFLSILQIMRAKSAINRKPANIEAQIEQQHQKSKILDEDRKNFHRQAEEIKEKNRQEIEKLRLENQNLKAVRDQYIANRKQRRPLTATGMDSQFSLNSNFNNRDQNYLRRLLDREKHSTKAKKTALYSLQDKLKQVQENKLGYIEESPLMRTIRVLENRLDKVMIKYNQAQSIQKTYELVVKRLREERVGYDNQLSVIEASLKGKQQDFQELLLLAHDATHAKQAAYSQLKRFQQRRVTVQEMRGKYISQKKNQLNIDIPTFQDQGIRGERKHTTQKLNFPQTNCYENDDQFQKQELGDYEQAFRKLKQVTGVIDANEIIQKFKTQGMTTASLEELRESYKIKIEELKEKKDQIKHELEQTRLINQRGTNNDRRRIDQIESDSAKISNQLQRMSLKSNKLEGTLINVKAGIQHLKDLTNFYKKQGESILNNEHLIGNSSLEQDLKSLNQKLRRMYDIVKNDPHYMKRNYKANAHVIQDMFEERDYEKIVKFDADDDN